MKTNNVNNIDVTAFINEATKGADSLLGLTGEAKPPIFIVGAPRSGTTILNQMLAAFTDCGYIDNLSASFWEAPATGVLLSRKLIKRRAFTGKSHFGQTTDISEPHEFGMFWRTHLKSQCMVQPEEEDVVGIDWNSLSDTLNQIALAWGTTTVFKVFQLVWHIKELRKNLPAARWLWIKRDLIENALSILKFRQSRLGQINQSLSSMPLAATAWSSGKTPFHQVVAQVFFTNQWIERELGLYYPDQFMKINLSNLRDEPDCVLNEIADFNDLIPQLDNLKCNKFSQPSSADYPQDWIDGVKEAVNDLIDEGVLDV